jgi:hypothetical protein
MYKRYSMINMFLYIKAINSLVIEKKQEIGLLNLKVISKESLQKSLFNICQSCKLRITFHCVTVCI